MENTIQSAPAQQKKHVSNQEFVLFLISVFFYTNMTGMVNGSVRHILSMCCGWIAAAFR